MGRFFVKISGRISKKKVSGISDGLFHTRIVSQFLECVCVCLSFFGTGCISRHWQFRSLAGSECLGS